MDGVFNSSRMSDSRATGLDSEHMHTTTGALPTSVMVQKLDCSASPLDRLHQDVFELFLPSRPLSLHEVSGEFHRQCFNYRVGSIGFSNPGVAWRIEWQGTIEGALLMWQPEVMQKAASALFGEDISQLTWRKALGDYVPAIAYLGLDIANQVTSDYPAGEKHVELLIEALLSLCLRRYASTKVRDTALAGIMSRQVLLAINFINANLTVEFSIDEICAQSAVSKSHLNRLFRTEVGISTWEYVQRQRIQQAGKLLKTSNHTIGHISMLLRFNSRSNFARRFFLEYGCTPSEYRERG